MKAEDVAMTHAQGNLLQSRASIGRPAPIFSYVLRAMIRFGGVIVFGCCTASAEELVPPFGLSWGISLEKAGEYSHVEQNGDDVGATLYPAGTLADTQEVVGFFCAGAGLQELQIATTRYDRASVLRRFGTALADLERTHGQHDGGNPEVGTAYWGDRLALEAYPSSKTKFIVVTTYHGPRRTSCRSLGDP